MRPGQLLLAALLIMTSLLARAEPISRPHMQVELKAELSQFTPGQPFWVAVQLQPEAGWYSLWQNPGDNGQATSLDWQLPKGWQIGPVHWPIPDAIDQDGITHFGYRHDHSLLVELTPPKEAKDLELMVKASWQLCQQQCLAEDALLTLPLKAGPKAQANHSGFFAKARQQLPRPLPSRGRMEIQQDLVSFALKVPELSGQPPRVFVANPNLVKSGALPRQLWQGDTLLVSLPKSAHYQAPPKAPQVLLVTQDQALLVGMNSPDPAEGQSPLWPLALLALAAGLLLNAMPFVFPVVALKALDLKTGQGWPYLGGVLASTWALAVLWWLSHLGGGPGGLDLQSPLPVAIFASLFALLGWRLLSRQPLPGRLMQQGLAYQPILAGVLVVVLASPGVAMLAPALKADLALWPLLALASALGLGLALPMVLLDKLAPLAPWLPKPSHSFKRLLALLLLLSAVWQLWVLQGLEGPAFLLLAALIIATGLWPLPWRLAKALAWLPLLAVMLGIVLKPQQQPDTLAFDEATLKERLAQHRPVLVNITADGCIPCKVNASTTLGREETRALFALYDITYLEGNWTNRDPAVGRYLASFNSSALPLYVLYDQQGQPHLLPQLLSPKLLAESLEAALQGAD
ncbi:protein-disulfide reductase DsbD domain-containing protein [Gallaecimonas xiamenensis]|uniref:Thiol:disulfide interchange protein n=1 Tax=Gallaecimonas xiamenensis 3-C-1 TaxID=745411 RepID=K2KD57_9GAMM|nr:protein-disulfide reductase DsbD domain-containing protein [Gallaecimonas xiamenensis]EKE75170.1 thiol:disulfide interchange protein [Gallaecimonas xiamenensis 3-C-1]